MAVTMDPKPETLRENVILKFKNLKVTWKLVVMSCFDLFWQDKIHFQVLTMKKFFFFFNTAHRGGRNNSESYHLHGTEPFHRRDTFNINTLFFAHVSNVPEY